MENFNIGDIISTIIMLLIFIAIFYVMIKMIKKLKPLATLPPQDTLLQKVDGLTTRVDNLELQVKKLSERHNSK
ncbi:hypothetical protein ACQKII_03615 [Lysinibacillus sp. NPDC048646]|uniref:hypothetical protein n=1 Tax=Lysinibacillus sp. NPDC048646 TaxID=3390574 RepID=UPI003CFEF2F2